MSKPKISVIMSTYNDEKYLELSIKSILNQTFKDFEFIIVNDGSTDGSKEIIEKYREKDDRIIVINNRRNSGLIKSLNEGLINARGKYIVRMDADDIAFVDRINIQFNFMESNPEISLSGGYVENINENGETLGIIKTPLKHDTIAKQLMKYNCMIHPSVIFRKSINIKYREKMLYVEDYDFYLNLLSKGFSMANVPHLLLKYRRVSSSITMSKRGKQILFQKKAFEFYNNRMQNRPEGYDSFDPNKILNLDINRNDRKLLIKTEIVNSFALNDLLKTRKLIENYHELYHILSHPILLIYLLSTYINIRILKTLKRLYKYIFREILR